MAFFQPASLDIDESILDRNLRIIDEPSSQPKDSDQFVSSASTKSKLKEMTSGINLNSSMDYPSVQVTPVPGLCIKSKNVKGEKVFINLCKIQEIPPPPPISDQDLIDIISKEDYDHPYRVPMSLGAPRKEEDKGGSPCWASDVAINSDWFDSTMENNIVFTTFVINLAMEGLCDKYGDDVNLDRNGWNILKNKKYLGKTQRHFIQQRSNKIKDVSLDKQSLTSKKDFAIKEITKLPKYKIIREPLDENSRPEYLITTVQLPGVRSVKELNLDVGEDRIIVESTNSGYLLDIFLPHSMNSDETVAQFHRDNQILTITTPVLFTSHQ